MRYWVFGEGRILGPYSREELSGLDGVHGGTLVCREGTTGVSDGDWSAVEALPELASLAVAAAPVGSLTAAFSEGLGSFEDVVGGVGGGTSLPPTFDDDPRFSFWMRDEAAEKRTGELEGVLRDMREQLAKHERRQDEILDRLNAKDGELQARDREIGELRARLSMFETGVVPAPRPQPAAKAPPPAVQAPAPATKPPASKAPQAAPPAAASPPPPAAAAPEMPALKPALQPDESPARAAARLARDAAKKPGLPSATGPLELSLDQLAAPAGGEAPAPALEAPEAGFGIPDSEALSPVAEMPPPLEFAAPSPEEGQLQPPPLEEPPPLADPGAAPPATAFLDPQFSPQAQPQSPGSFVQPHTVIFGGGGGTPGGVSLTPGPAPFGSTPEPIPLGDPGAMTPMPSMGQPDLPQNVMAGLGVAGQATPFPGMSTATPLPRLPGQDTASFEAALTAPRPQESSPGQPPQVPPTGATKPSAIGKVKEALRSKKFVIVLAVAVLALVGIMMSFLRNPKQLAKTVDMAPEQKTQGSFNVDGPAPAPKGQRAPSPFQKPPGADGAPPAQEPAPAPAPKPKFPAQRPDAAPAAPPAAPPKSRDYISDQGVEAMEFVKNYKLDEARGTIAAYLQYAFLGPDTQPRWTAGAVEKDVWFVEYNLYKGGPTGRGSKPTYTYRFEVDLAKKTLVGRNPSATEMLSGGRSDAKPAKRPLRRHRRPAASGNGGQEPLPGDEELDGAQGSGAGGGFNNPGG